MHAYTQPVDLMNRALQHLKKPRITTPTDDVQGANELFFSYDKVRQAELQRNVWTVATRRQRVRPIRHTTYAIKPALWNVATLYPAASIVDFPIGTHWISHSPSTGVQPSVTAVDQFGDLIWDSYFGPLTAQPWLPTNLNGVVGSPHFGTFSGPVPTVPTTPGYDAGEIVFFPIGDGTAAVYECLSPTTDSPLYARAFESDFYYNVSDVVSYPTSGTFILGPNGSLLSGPDTLGNILYVSNLNVNLGNDPQITQLNGGALAWNSTTAYVATDYAFGSDNQVYLATGSSTGVNPVTEYTGAFWVPQAMYMGAWQTLGTVQSVNPHWRLMNANLVPITMAWPRGTRTTWPAGFGPLEQEGTGNVYRLPAGWLRPAPDHPKDGLVTALGGPTFIPWSDHTYEGDFLLSGQGATILLRFVADVQDVTAFSPMLCEAIALQLAIENAAACDGEDQLAACMAKYDNVVRDARTVDAIEAGPQVDSADDEWVTCRA